MKTCEKMECDNKCNKPYTLFVELSVKNKYWKVHQSVCFIDIMTHLYTCAGWDQKWFVLEEFNDSKNLFESFDLIKEKTNIINMIEFDKKKNILNSDGNLLTASLFTQSAYISFMAKREKNKK